MWPVEYYLVMMRGEHLHSSYDRIAGMYDRHWRNSYVPAALPALQQLFFDAVPANSSVLDVCCGSGHVTRELVRRGYKVTGVDASSELLKLARNNAPSATLLQQDVRQLRLHQRLDAALSTFDALNHLLSLEDLQEAFTAIRGALHGGSLFVFDMNLEEAYSLDLRKWSAIVEDDNVALIRGEFDQGTKLASTELVHLVREDSGKWNRYDSVVEERCYQEEAVLDLLRFTGWSEVRATPSHAAGLVADVGFGRVFFSARA